MLLVRPPSPPDAILKGTRRLALKGGKDRPDRPNLREASDDRSAVFFLRFRDCTLAAMFCGPVRQTLDKCESLAVSSP